MNKEEFNYNFEAKRLVFTCCSIKGITRTVKGARLMSVELLNNFLTRMSTFGERIVHL